METNQNKISLTCEEDQRDFEYEPSSVETKRNSPKQTTLDTFFHPSNCDTPSYEDQTKLQYLVSVHNKKFPL